MTPSARMDLEFVMQAGGMCMYARMRFRIRPGCPQLRGSLVDTAGHDARYLLEPNLKALEDACERAGQGFQLHVERVWVHPVDSNVRAFERVIRGAVRLACRHGLGGDAAWGADWRPPRTFRVRCIQSLSEAEFRGRGCRTRDRTS